MDEIDALIWAEITKDGEGAVVLTETSESRAPRRTQVKSVALNSHDERRESFDRNIDIDDKGTQLLEDREDDPYFDDQT